MTLEGLRVGYVPYTQNLSAPGDRRRFPFYANRRGIQFEIAEPAGTYDVVVLSAAADVTYWAGREARTKLIFELIDSYLALPRSNPKSMLRGPAKYAARQTRRLALSYHRALERMCQRADAVVCSTTEQREQILEFCPNVHVILDAHTELSCPPKSDYRIEGAVNLVWEGLPHTLGGFTAVRKTLRDLSREIPLTLHLVTDLEFRQYARRFVRRHTLPIARRITPETSLYQWHPRTLGPIITSCDIALIPLDLDDPLSRGKPENKLLIFWRLGMPAVVSATPAYGRAMRAAGLELACANDREWAEALRHLISDEHARRLAGEAGRRHATSMHSEERLLAQWDHLFESLA